NNMISVTNSWVALQKISPLAGLWGLHLAMLGVLFVLFRHRSSVAPWWRLGR
ncbi:MAG: LPS export ABC transporter permease LptF, partial [Gallionellales bacterium CG08_land_8_20_14_0_20_59_87]